MVSAIAVAVIIIVVWLMTLVMVVVGVIAVIRSGVVVGTDGGCIDNASGGGWCHRCHPWGSLLMLMVVVRSIT